MNRMLIIELKGNNVAKEYIYESMTRSVVDFIT